MSPLQKTYSASGNEVTYLVLGVISNPCCTVQQGFRYIKVYIEIESEKDVDQMKDKKAFRKAGREILTNLTAVEREEIVAQIHHHVQQTEWWKKAKTIGITISREFEIDTRPFIKQAWKEGKQVAIPKCFPEDDHKMVFYHFDDYSILETVYSGLLEPDILQTEPVLKESINLMFVPGLMFDRNGYRIGYGGGYYDRYLGDFSGTTISLAYSGQVVDHVPRNDYDIPVQHLVTEKGKLF